MRTRIVSYPDTIGTGWCVHVVQTIFCEREIYVPPGRSFDDLEQIVEEHATRLAKTYGGDRDETRDLLWGTVEWGFPEFPTENGEPEFHPSIEDALQWLGPEAVQRLFWQLDDDGVCDLGEREEDYSWLYPASKSQLFTIEELETITRDFIDHQRRNRDHIVSTGWPRTPFGKSQFFDDYLNRCYACNLPLEIELSRYSEGAATPGYSYRWPSGPVHCRSWEVVRGTAGEVVYAKCEPVYPSTCEEVPFRDAVLICTVSIATGARVERDRERLFDFRMQVLQLLSDCVRLRDGKSIWREFADILKGTLSVNELVFYVDLEQLIREASLFDCGGITSIIRAVVCYEEELINKTFSHMRYQMGDEQMAPSYFACVARMGRSKTDKLIFSYWEALSRSWHFWERLSQIDLDVDVTYRLPAGSPEAASLTNELTAIADLLRTHFEATGRVPDLSIGISGSAAWHSVRSIPNMRPSNDFTEVIWSPGQNERRFAFNKNQAPVVRLLIEAFEQGRKGLTQSEVLKALQRRGRLRDLMRSSNGWGTLIVSGPRKGWVRLCVPPRLERQD
jgi:hypothetical protein